MFLRFAVFTALLVNASGQTLSVGIAGGGAVTNAFEPITTFFGTTEERSSSRAKDFVAGATIEYQLPWNFSVEADGLFRELHMTLDGSPAPVVTWELPVLAKYRFRWSRIDSFGEAGPAFRTTGNLNAMPSHYGFAAGVGMDLYLGHFDIAPVLRYTRWAHDPAEFFPVSEAKSDQLELLLEISRRSGPTSRPPGTHRFSMGLITGTNLVGDYPNTSAPTTVTQAIPLPGGGFGPGPPIPATAYQSGDNSLLGGLAMEFALPKGLFVELDALHHPLCRSERIVPSDGGVLNYPESCGVTWEIPTLAKYKFGAGRFKPFVHAGPSVRVPSFLSNYGLNAGAGVETQVGWLRIAPQIRYTRWSSETRADLVPVTRNQILFLTTFLL